MGKFIYLDNAATTKTSPEVVEVMVPYFSEFYGNPSSVYSLASESKKAVADAREIIAESLGVSEKVIGLTIVALGTSLPELVTAITSLNKCHGSLSLGNVFGANLFNLVLVSGAAVTISPFDVPVSGLINGINSSFIIDIPVMLAVMLILTVPTLIKQKLSRWQGIALLGIYAAFCVVQFAV